MLLQCLSLIVHLTMNVLGFNSSGTEPNSTQQTSEAAAQQRLLQIPAVVKVKRCSSWALRNSRGMQVRDCYVHALSCVCDLSGEAWQGAGTTAGSAQPATVDIGLLHHSVYLKKMRCLACPEVNSQEFLPSAQTEQMTSFPSSTLLPRQCHNLFKRSR